jgi:aspartate aminotransferase
LSPSPTIAIDSQAKALAREGIDVINFSAGEPDFDAPATAREGVIEAVTQGKNKYTPTAGYQELLQEIARKFRDENGLQYAPEQIVVSNGAKHSIMNAFLALVDPGDEVLFQSPYWVSYPEMAKLCGGVPVVVETTEATGFKMTPEMLSQKLTARSKLLVLNSPSNPTGAVYHPDELRALVEVAVRRGLYIVSDEIYEHLLYDGAVTASPASFGTEAYDRTVTVNGFSKAYAMTGWRAGYLGAPPAIAKAINAIQSQMTSGISSLTQMGALRALQGSQAPREEMRQAFDERRQYVVKRLAAIPGLRLTGVPRGAFYVFPNVSGTYGRTIGETLIDNSDTLARVLLAKANVAVVPGSGFGAPDYVRMSYANSMERLKTGLDRIQELLG